jgi:hypothetical protein
MLMQQFQEIYAVTSTAHRFEPGERISELVQRPFDGITFAYELGHTRTLSVVMHGDRALRLRFTGLIALRFEDDVGNFESAAKAITNDWTTFDLSGAPD